MCKDRISVSGHPIDIDALVIDLMLIAPHKCFQKKCGGKQFTFTIQTLTAARKKMSDYFTKKSQTSRGLIFRFPFYTPKAIRCSRLPSYSLKSPSVPAQHFSLNSGTYLKRARKILYWPGRSTAQSLYLAQSHQIYCAKMAVTNNATATDCNFLFVWRWVCLLDAT